MNQTKVTGEEKSTEKGVEATGASQLDATISGVTEQDKNVNLTHAEAEKSKVTEEELAELGLDDLSLNDKTVGDDLWATPMVSDESNESYFTDDEATMNMSFQTAMKEADRAEGMTSFKDIPEYLIERTQTGKVINVRPPSPNSPTTTLRTRVRELESELEAKESQAMKRTKENRDKLSSLEARIYELEQQQVDLENAADEWKIKYERQRELAEEYLKMADDREMEGHLAVGDLNESMSEETAERSRHLAELKDECDSLKLKVTEAETKRDEYATKLADATQRLLTNTTEVFKLRNDLKLRDENIGTLQKESYDHQRRADEAAKVAKDLRDLTATEGVRLKNEIRQVMEENKALKDDNKKVTEENTELKKTAKTIAEQGMRWEHEAHLLDEKVTVLELKDKEWQQSVHQKTQEIIKLNTELIDMTQTVMTREDEVTQTKNQLKAAVEEYTKLERDVTQLAEHIKKVENDTEKVVQEKTFQLHQHMLKVKEENQNLKTEKEEVQLKVRRLEDENKALVMSNKHKDEQLLQYGVRTSTVESPPPSYSKAKRIITEKQAVGFLIEGCRVDNELYKALRTQKCRTPTDVKDFFRHWATGEEKYKAPKGQRNQDYVTIRQGQVENVPQQRMVAAPAQQQMEFRAETPVREVTERVTFIDGQTGQPITYAMVAAIQAAAQETGIMEMAAARMVATAVVATAAEASEEEAEASAAEIGMAATEMAETEVAKETTNRVVAKIMVVARVTEADKIMSR
ncbi:myosin-2 heavy chain-like, partial [Paramacrobiotus metropolitanus]|uniref:myosin-2 heavy chain-like n=1 Tax=Paramacrobiotus metropolitanus TaxID=2943436 RepID=UPI002445DC64